MLWKLLLRSVSVPMSRFPQRVPGRSYKTGNYKQHEQKIWQVSDNAPICLSTFPFFPQPTKETGEEDKHNDDVFLFPLLSCACHSGFYKSDYILQTGQPKSQLMKCYYDRHYKPCGGFPSHTQNHAVMSQTAQPAEIHQLEQGNFTFFSSFSLFLP